MWKTIDSVPKNVPVIILLNNTVQNVTYAFDGEDWYTIQDEECMDDDDFKPTHWHPLPKKPKL
jgi:hypothetical protein